MEINNERLGAVNRIGASGLGNGNAYAQIMISRICGCARRAKAGMPALLREEKGDLVSSLGWMAVMALALVLVKGIVDGGITTYANSVFTHLDRIFGP